MKLIVLLILGIILSGCVERVTPYPSAFDITEIAPNFTEYFFPDQNITCFVFDDGSVGASMECFEGLK